MRGHNVAGRLTPTQQKLLDSRIKGRAASPQRVPRITRRPTEDSAPLSFSQDRLWFLDQLQPGDAAYNMLAVVKFRGRFNQLLLEQVVGEMVRRHETLRTRFEDRDGQPMPIIGKSRPFRLQADEIVVAENLTDGEIAVLVSREGMRPFDLGKGPLFRIRVFRRSEEDHLIAMTMHHIISDGWSMRILGEEIRSLYVAFSAGLRSPLEELPIQYGDYAYWQRSQLAGGLLDRQLKYWKSTLADLPGLELPTDHVRPPLQTSKGGVARIEIPPALTQQLADLSRGQRTTMFMTLLAGFSTLLSLWTSQTDIVVGTPIAGRTDPLVERLIGFFVNNLVLRTDLSGDPTFTDVLRKVRDVALGAYTHPDLPFEKLVEALKPARDLSRSPLFQVLINSHELETSSTPQSDGVFDVEEDLLSSERANSKFDLNLYLKQHEGVVRISLVYNLDLFKPETIEKLLQRYLSILRSAAQRPEARLSDLDLLSEADRECLLGKWNKTFSEYPRDSSLHKLFLAQVARTPEAVAVVGASETLTYRELAERSAAVALRLGQLGVGRETIVGVCADRSADMIVGLLGILQAGAAYLPLDPDDPKQRIDYLMGSAHAGIVVAADRHAPVFAGAVQLVSPSGPEAGLPLAAMTEGHAPKGSARQLAYIIFTSGSTGTPKGVMVEHQQVLNYVFGVQKNLSLGSCRNFAMLQSLMVGSAISVLYPSLLSGACLHVIDRNTALDAEAFAAYVSKRRIDCIKIAPSHLQTLIAAARNPENVLSDVMIVAGEPLSASLAGRVVELRPNIRLFNHYGTTETTIGVLTTPVGEGSTERSAASMSPARASPVAISARPDRRPTAICRRRSTKTARARDFIEPATLGAGSTTALSSFSGERTTRSRSAAFGSNSERSRRRCCRIRACSRRACFLRRYRRATPNWSPSSPMGWKRRSTSVGSQNI
jgi:non-ribosomal peptide synthetase component F